MRMAKGKPFLDVEYEGPGKSVPNGAPVFSEACLYPRLGKGDARFVLGVAEEYDHIIQAIGPKAVRAILGVKPRLVERLGTGTLVVEHLEDARDDQDLWREEQVPSEIIIDADAAEQVWTILFNEYRGYFEPEKTMDNESLRLLNKLTELLGDYEQKRMKEEKAKEPEKLKRKKQREKEIKERREARRALINVAKGEKMTKAETIEVAENWARANGYIE